MKYNELRNEIKSYYSTVSYENAKKYEIILDKGERLW